MAPIKRSEYLKQLSRDHHYSLLFAWKLRQGINHKVPVNRMTSYIIYFEKEMLRPHFEEEETLVFTHSDSPLVRQAKSEHLGIYAAIQSIRSSPAEPGYHDLETLANLVDQHVRFEERQVFPYLEMYLTKQQLEKIARDIKSSPSVQDNYEDHFWELGQQ